MLKIIYVGRDGAERVLDITAGRSVIEGGRDAGEKGILAERGGASCHAFIASDRVGRIQAASLPNRRGRDGAGLKLHAARVDQGVAK